MMEKLNNMKETAAFMGAAGIRFYCNNENGNYFNHWHTTFEIIMPIHNDFTVICNNIIFNLKVGDVLIVSPGVLHNIPVSTSEEGIIILADFSLLPHVYLKELESILFIISPAIVITKETSPAIHERVQQIMLIIKNEYFSDSILRKVSIYALLIKMFVLIGREYTANMDTFYETTSKQKVFIEKFLLLCNYIDNNCTKNLSLDFIADMAGFSKYHFERLFRQFTGVSFSRYQALRKIRIAETLLINPNNSITEIALHSGFTSLSSFNRMFRIIKSCTPTEFRKMYL